MSVIDNYLQNKYENRDNSRFKKTRGEYHASGISKCQRKLVWEYDMNPEAEASSYPYFLLGNIFEGIYGNALEDKHGHECVKQDVEIVIHVDDDIQIVGESDWCIVEPEFDYDKVEWWPDEDRRDGIYTEPKPNDPDIREEMDRVEDIGNPGVRKVIETKTTKETKWKTKYGHDKHHYYQVSTYQVALQAPGEIVYMQRNDLDEVKFSFEYDPDMYLDIESRVRKHHANLGSDDLPPTTPMKDFDCKFCPFKSECKTLGGSQWE